MQLFRLILLGLASTAVAGGLRAQIALTPLSNPSSFSGLQQVVGFNTLANNEPITNQFASQGVVFSPGLYGSTNSGDTNYSPTTPTASSPPTLPSP